VNTKEDLIAVSRRVRNGKYDIPSIMGELKGPEGLKNLRSMLTLD